MFEGLTEIALAIWTFVQVLSHWLSDYIATSVQSAFDRIASLEPTQRVVLWIQLIVGLMTIVWIIFQSRGFAASMKRDLSTILRAPLALSERNLRTNEPQR